MASTTVNELIFGGTKFRESVVEAWAKVPSFLPLISYEPAGPGLKEVKVPVLGAFTAYDLALNATTAVEAQANTDSEIVVPLNRYAAHHKRIDVGVAYQQAVDTLVADNVRVRQAHTAKINANLMTALRATTPLVTVSGNSAASPASTPAEIAAAIEKAVTDAQVAFDTQWGVGNTWDKNIWLPSKLFRNLAMGTTKQTKENGVDDNGLLIVEGIPGMFQGATPYNVGTVASVVDPSTNTTRYEFWVATPDVLLAGVQLDMIGNTAPIPGTALMSYTMLTLYGFLAGPANQAVKCYVHVSNA